jgi:hypothetical protein
VKKLILTHLLLAPLAAFSQPAKSDSLWRPFLPLIGNWSGEGGGESGHASYTRSYEFILGGQCIEVKNISVYAPQDKNPNGERHEDRGLISYDRAVKTFVYRQHHSEGFVNEYRLDSLSADGHTLRFTTYAIQNIPHGWRARETWTIHDGELTEVFELAPPGKAFSVYSGVLLRRAK